MRVPGMQKVRHPTPFPHPAASAEPLGRRAKATASNYGMYTGHECPRVAEEDAASYEEAGWRCPQMVVTLQDIDQPNPNPNSNPNPNPNPNPCRTSTRPRR